jgi:hypothetical protein
MVGMSRPIEAVVADAQERLERFGKLNIEAYTTAYPEYVDELQRVLTTMVAVYQERSIKRLADETFAFAVGLFTLPAAETDESPIAGTVGALVTEELDRTGHSVETYAEEKGLTLDAVRAMKEDRTPVADVAASGSVIKQLAQRWAAPFSTILVELRRLIAMDTARGGTSQLLFTRDRETSTTEEHEALMRRVFEATSKPPLPPDSGSRKP